MRVDRRELAAVFAGGCAGAIVRAQLAETVGGGGAWPWATFVANVGGAFLLGYVAAWLRDRGPAADLRLRLLGTGFCGALTTFSTLQLELLGHARRRPWRARRWPRTRQRRRGPGGGRDRRLPRRPAAERQRQRAAG